MNKITKETLTTLMDNPTSPSITLYVPTHRTTAPKHFSEDQTRFKNLTSKALKILEEYGEYKDFANEFSKQTSKILEDIDFWEDQTEGLVVCARPGEMQLFNLPIDCEEYVAVDDHFHLAPLLGLVDELQPFYLLAMKQQDPFLMKGDAYDLKPTELKLPKDIIEAMNIDELHQRSTQFFSIEGGAGAEYHGHGGAKDSGEWERRHFMRIVYDKVAHFVDGKTPIVLAGTGDEISEFMALSSMNTVLPDFIEGSFTEDQTRELRERAVELVRHHVIEPKHQEALKQYERLVGQEPERVEDSVAGIKDAAEKGKVETLLLGIMQYTTDTIRDNKDRVVKLTFPAERSRLAMDQLALLVWKQGGHIMNMYAQKMPQPATVLAINRY